MGGPGKVPEPRALAMAAREATAPPFSCCWRAPQAPRTPEHRGAPEAVRVQRRRGIADGLRSIAHDGTKDAVSLTVQCGSLLLPAIAIGALARPVHAPGTSNAASCVACHEPQGLRPVPQTARPWHVDPGFGDLRASCHTGAPAASAKKAAHLKMRQPLANHADAGASGGSRPRDVCEPRGCEPVAGAARLRAVRRARAVDPRSRGKRA